MTRLPIALFCGPKSINVAKLSIGLHAAYDSGFPITVVCPARVSSAFESQVQSGINVVHDESIIDSSAVWSYLLDRSESIASRNRSVSWYYQQYLKLAFAWMQAAPVFVQDGDTSFSIPFLLGLEQYPFLIRTNEDISVYSKGLSLLGIASDNISYIANGGYFCPQLLRELIDSPFRWFVNCLDTIFSLANCDSDFSEYQIMGSLLSSKMSTKKLRLFRRMDLLAFGSAEPMTASLVRNALRRYDAICFEVHHNRSYSRKVAAYFAFFLGLSW